MTPTTETYKLLARQLYPDWDEAGELFDYRPILNWMGTRWKQQAIVYSKELDGFCFVVYQSGSEIGVLEFAFGCCRNCDKLNDCRSYDELGFMIEQMIGSIEWLKRFELMPGLMKIRARLIVPEQVKLFEKLCSELFD